jgi:hypothetical protein
VVAVATVVSNACGGGAGFVRYDGAPSVELEPAESEIKALGVGQMIPKNENWGAKWPRFGRPVGVWPIGTQTRPAQIYDDSSPSCSSSAGGADSLPWRQSRLVPAPSNCGQCKWRAGGEAAVAGSAKQACSG